MSSVDGRKYETQTEDVSLSNIVIENKYGINECNLPVTLVYFFQGFTCHNSLIKRIRDIILAFSC